MTFSFNDKLVNEGGGTLIVDSLNLAFRWKHRGDTDFRYKYQQTVQSLAKSYNCDKIIITADLGASSYRKEIDGEYKQNRAEKIAKQNGYQHVINYSKTDFAKEVLKITNNKGVTAVFDGVGKKTFKNSIACLRTRGMMVSFGNASGPLDPINVQKDIQAKSLFFTRPAGGHYFTERKELQAAADVMFEKVKFGKIKVNIFKEFKLDEAKKAHEELESRKLNGPCILIP